MSHPMAVQPTKIQDPSKVARRLLPYLAPFKAKLALIGVLLIVGTLAELAGPYLIGVAVDQFIDPAEGIQRAAWLTALLGDGVSRLQGLNVVMGLLAVTFLLSWALQVFQFRLMVRISQSMLLKLRSQIFEHIQSLSLKFFSSHETGDLMSRLANDTQIINQMFGEGLMRILRTTLTLVGIVASMISLNWRLALASYTALPLVLLLTLVFSRRVRSAYRQTRRTIGEVSAELQENISGVREVQAFSRESHTMQEFQEVNARNRTANVQAETLSSFLMPALDVLTTIALAIVTGFGGYLFLMYSPPLVSIGLIVSFLTYTRRFYMPISEMANMYAQFQAAVAGAERIFDLLDVQPEVMDAPDAIALPPAEGHIEYDHVSFRYTENEPVLQDVSLKVEPGQMVALVGPTGSGKTTMVSLLMRFYDVDEGAIRIDGHDLREITNASLREQIGMVPQDTFLFSGTIMQNIRYGRPDATDEEVIAAAKLANAHSFIERLPQGYETQVGERGATLSQGYRQLLAIARAVLNNPRILVLDEATSSVDTRTELLIQRALAELLKGRTSIVIAHRLSTIRNADQVIVIQNGKIVERGTHQTLLAQGGVYHGLYMSQFRRQEEEAQAEPANAEPSAGEELDLSASSIA
ncbi:MAG: ABC transporter ATP-binding protein [Chloroflexi bacterium]|jgi:ATP-binding cassette subfamily B multidrug efflux pump|nr:ABC transporter ATP-binding protein [Chloroflexota bacterium]